MGRAEIARRIDPRTRRRLKRGAALGGSLLFHLALFLVVFSRAAGSLVSAADAGGGPTGPVFAVSLVRLEAAPDSADAATAEVRPLLIKLRTTHATEGVPVPTKPQTSPLTGSRLPSPPRRRASPIPRTKSVPKAPTSPTTCAFPTPASASAAPTWARPATPPTPPPPARSGARSNPAGATSASRLLCPW